MYELEIPNLFKKGLSIGVFSLIAVYFFGLVNIEHTSLGITEPLFPITEKIEIVFSIIFWFIIGIFSLAMVFSYLEIRNFRIFLRKDWLEIILLGLMIIFGVFEMLNVSLPILNQIKISKFIFKILKISLAIIDQIVISKSWHK